MQNSLSKFHNFSFQSSKFGFRHFNPLRFIFFLIKFSVNHPLAPAIKKKSQKLDEERASYFRRNKRCIHLLRKRRLFLAPPDQCHRREGYVELATNVRPLEVFVAESFYSKQYLDGFKWLSQFIY